MSFCCTLFAEYCGVMSAICAGHPVTDQRLRLRSLRSPEPFVELHVSWFGALYFKDAEIEQQFRRDAWLSSLGWQTALAAVAVILSVAYLFIGVFLQGGGALSVYDGVMLALSIALTVWILQRWYACRHWLNMARMHVASASSPTSRKQGPFGVINSKYERTVMRAMDAYWCVVVLLLGMRGGVFLLLRCSMLWQGNPLFEGMCSAYTFNTTYDLVALPIVIVLLFVATVSVSPLLSSALILAIFAFSAAMEITRIVSLLNMYSNALLGMLGAVYVAGFLALMAVSWSRAWVLRNQFAAILALERQNELDKALHIELDAQRERSARVEAAQRTHSAVGDLIAHQIRNPLHQMGSLLEVWESEHTDRSFPATEFRDAIGVLRNVVDEMQLERQLLSGSLRPLTSHVIQLRTVVQGIVDGFAGSLLRVHVSFAPVTPEYIATDEYMLKQLIANLVAAPIQLLGPQYMRSELTLNCALPRLLSLTARFSVTTSPDTDNTASSMMDGGEAVQTHFVQSWYQQQAALGVTVDILKRLTDAFNGHYEQLCGADGTCEGIEIVIPISEVSKTQRKATEIQKTPTPPPALPPVTSALIPSPSLRKKHILVVDDSPMNRSLHSRLVAKFGYTVSTCSDGDEVLPFLKSAAAQEQIVDTIMLDIVMPRMDGIACCKLLRSQQYNLPIFAVTANAAPSARDQLINDGFTDLLAKPFTSQELSQLLQRYIGL